MTQIFKTLQQSRRNLINIVKGLSLDQINHIPEGFNNNVAWNFIHAVITAELLTYGRTDNEDKLMMALVNRFRKGTKPETDIDIKEWESFKERAMMSVDQIEKDYQNGLFANYSAYETSYGITLNNIGEALNFALVHDSLHLGYIMALKKSLN